MKYSLLRLFLGPVCRIGRWAERVLSDVDRRNRIATALPPGTKLKITCKCHPANAIWYVISYEVEADDYKVSMQWPLPESAHVGDYEFQRLNTKVEVLS